MTPYPVVSHEQMIVRYREPFRPPPDTPSRNSDCIAIFPGTGVLYTSARWKSYGYSGSSPQRRSLRLVSGSGRFPRVGARRTRHHHSFMHGGSL